MADATFSFQNPVRVRALVHPDTPDAVRMAIWAFADEIFRDVHALLQMPLPIEGRTPQFHYTIAAALLSVMGGISRMLYDPAEEVKADRECFRLAFESAFPWDQEPPPQPSAAYAAELLYTQFRCPFVHAMGAPNKPGKRLVIRLVRMAPWRLGELEELASRESLMERPKGWPPTIFEIDSMIGIRLDCLYWGLRRMIYELTCDPVRMAQAEQVLLALERDAVGSDFFLNPSILPDGAVKLDPNPMLVWESDHRIWPAKKST